MLRPLFKKFYYLATLILMSCSQNGSQTKTLNAVILNENEQLFEHKINILRTDFLNTFDDPQDFYKQAFHTVKSKIDSSKLIPLFKQMPKGANLHTHSLGTTDIDWLVNEAAKIPECFVYLKHNSSTQLYGSLNVMFSNDIPEGYSQLANHLKKHPEFKQELKKLLTLQRSSLSETIKWISFEDRFSRIAQLVTYRPFFKKYYKRTFNNAVIDGISHLEIRFIFGELFDKNQNKYPVIQTLSDINTVYLDFKKDHPEFSLKLIYTSFKFFDLQQIKKEISTAFDFKIKYPELIAGFDIVAEEDTGNTIAFFKDAWAHKTKLEKQHNLSLPLLLHAGESNSSKNHNILQAINANAKRIGHGLNIALLKGAIKKTSQNKILIEVNPISNQILGYVSDLRNHPARTMLTQNIPIALSNDDPGVFNYSSLGYDYFYAYVAWELDLTTLKQLIYNSINHSLLSPMQQKNKKEAFERAWNNFIEQSI